MRYVAYGLGLDSSFPLPGMSSPACEDPAQPEHEPRSQHEPRPEREPPLAIELVERVETTARSPRRAPAWVGALGDGCELRIERGAGDDLLFGYGERARFHLDAERRSLLCAPSGAGPDLDWQRALISKVIPSVSVVRGHEALHAAAVDLPCGAVAIAAPSGAGKTTLALELVRRGHRLLSDDVLALTHDGETDAVWAHPGTPHMNLDARDPRTNAALGEGLVDSIATLAGERWVAVRSLAARPRPLAAVLLLHCAPHLRLGAETVTASPLPLAPYMLGIDADVERKRSRFRLYAALAGAATIVHLSCSRRDEPGAIADLIEHALLGVSARAPSFVGACS